MSDQLEPTEKTSSDIDYIPSPETPAVSPLILFGKKNSMKLMTLGFAVFGLGVFLNLYTRSAQWTVVIAAIGFIMYLFARILYAVSKNR